MQISASCRRAPGNQTRADKFKLPNCRIDGSTYPGDLRFSRSCLEYLAHVMYVCIYVHITSCRAGCLPALITQEVGTDSQIGEGIPPNPHSRSDAGLIYGTGRLTAGIYHNTHVLTTPNCYACMNQPFL